MKITIFDNLSKLKLKSNNDRVISLIHFRVTVEQTVITATNKLQVTSTQMKKSSGGQIKSSESSLLPDIKPTKSLTLDTSHTSVKLAEEPIFLQSSHDYILPSVNAEPTESLTFVVTTDGIKESTVKNHEITKTYKKMNATATDKIPVVVAIQTDQSLKNTDTTLPKEYSGFKINQTNPITVKPNVGTVIYENVSDTNIGVKPKEVMYQSHEKHSL